LDSLSVSRRHCLIVGREDELFIRDLESRNGTFVNDIPIKEKKLTKGDKIRIGDSVFILVSEEDEAARKMQDRVQPDTTTILSVDTLHLSTDGSIYRDNPAVSIRPASRLVKDLNTLMSFSSSISSIGTVDELQRRFLKSIVDISPAEFACFLQLGLDENEIESICGWDRITGFGARVHPSRTVVNQVLTTRTAVLIKGVVLGGPFSSAESLVRSHVQSVLCAP